MQTFDIVKIGDATLYHADCREVLPALGKFDLLLTDPPYGVLSESGSAATRRSGGNANDGLMQWDVVPESELIAAMLASAEVSAIWGGCHLNLAPTYGYLVWDKQIDGLNFGEVEFCWTTGKFAPRIFRYRAVGVDGGKQHPTQKPIALMEWCFRVSPTAKTVLDPFMGSGTTGVACAQSGRSFTGIERERKYFDIACERIERAYAQGKLFAPEIVKPQQAEITA